jgi:hypothetical protein
MDRAKRARRKSIKGPQQRGQRSLRLEPFEERVLFAIAPFQLVGVLSNPDTLLSNAQVLRTAPTELTLRFNNSVAANTITSSNIYVERGGADRDLSTSPITVTAGSIGPGTRDTDVVVRFANALPDDVYQIRVKGTLKDTSGQSFNGGADLNPAPTLTLDLSPQVVAIVPQPIERDTATNKLKPQAVNQIDVYFNVNDPLEKTSAENRFNYQLIRTNNTATTADDGAIINPTGDGVRPAVTYDAATGKATLLFGTTTNSPLLTPGTFRLRIGNSDPLALAPPTGTAGFVSTAQAGSTFATSKLLNPDNRPGTNPTIFNNPQGTQSLNLSGPGAFIGGSYATGLVYPGGPDEPGARDIPVENHLLGTPDTTGVIPVYAYNFQSNIGKVLGVTANNVITEPQKQRIREVFAYYARYLGVEFVEVPDATRTGVGSITFKDNFTIARGDIRAVNANLPGNTPSGITAKGWSTPTGVENRGEAVMSSSVDWGSSEPGGDFFQTAMAEIGHLLGLGNTFELPQTTVQGSAETTAPVSSPGEPVFPGDADITLGQYLHPPVGNGINMYQFSLARAGQLTIETFAERLRQINSSLNPSLLDSVVTLFDESKRVIARNDDYFGDDSFLQLQLAAGTYYIGVSSTGNTDYDPAIANSGAGGTTQGAYQLRLTFNPAPTLGIRDQSPSANLLDGDADGTAGGANNFWFRTATAAQTLIVDKAATTPGSGNIGTYTNPYNTIKAALNAATDGYIVRVVGNGGADKNLATLGDNLSYNIGFDSLGIELPDGPSLDVPGGVSVMVDAGAILKLHAANIDVGTSTQGVNRSNGALQILGTPTNSVQITSYYNTAIGTDSNQAKGTLARGDWGGIVFRNDPNLKQTNDYDQEEQGIFLNYVNHANISYAGGAVAINGAPAFFDAIHLVTARPTITYNNITNSARAAVSADPNSFQESEFQFDDPKTATVENFVADYSRRGPTIYGNTLGSSAAEQNAINGIFVRISTPSQSTLTTAARFTTTDMVYVLQQSLKIQGIVVQNPDPLAPDLPGKYYQDPNDPTRLLVRSAGRLAIDPGVVIKLDKARIEAQIGATLLAEGTTAKPIIFTSVLDDRYGAGGVFDTTSNGSSSGTEGDWGGLFFGPLSRGSLDHVLVTFAGGTTTVEGGSAKFNPIEIHQAQVRISSSLLERNAAGGDATNRAGRKSTTEAVIFVQGAQPVLVNNIIQNNATLAGAASSAAAISINVNALNSQRVRDWGFSTRAIDLAAPSFLNYGPLVRGNRLANNPINGMLVRGGTITTNVVWDDTDIVHVLRDAVIANTQFALSGTVRLQSSSTESLVVKLLGDAAGFVASGIPLDINDRVGGSVQVIGQAGHPVILTSIYDMSVGAGITPTGQPQNDTRNQGTNPTVNPAPGDWQGVVVLPYSNDTNIDVINEVEQSFNAGSDTNSAPGTAQKLGALAKDYKSGDENLRLGFEVHGTISQSFSNPGGGDVDLYTFTGTAGSTVWFDIDQTSPGLDSVVELVDSSNNVLARSDNSLAEQFNASANPLVGIARPMQIGFTNSAGPFTNPDYYTTNPLDAGMRLDLGGIPGTTQTYYVRVRSSNANVATNILSAGTTKGAYVLNIRLQNLDQFAGSVIRGADIRYAKTGIAVVGKPENSPLVGGTASASSGSNVIDASQQQGDNRQIAQDLGNLLTSSQNEISVSGNLATPNSVAWFKFDLNYDLVEKISGFSDGLKSFATMFSVNYADGLNRPDTSLAVFDANGNLIFVGRDSDTPDGQPRPDSGSDTSNQAHGNYGGLDPTIGSVQLPAGTVGTGNLRTYYVAVSSTAVLPAVLDGTFRIDSTNGLVRLEPIDSVLRVADDRIGSTGTGTSSPSQQLFPGSSPAQISQSAIPYTLADMTLFVTESSHLISVNPFTGQVQTFITQNPDNLVDEQGNQQPEPGMPSFRNRDYMDMAMRDDGRLFSFPTGLGSNNVQETNGLFVQIDTSTGLPISAQNNGILTYDLAQPENHTLPSLTSPGLWSFVQQSNAPSGIRVNAMAFDNGIGIGDRALYIIGNRTANDAAIDETQNLLFRLSPNTGAHFGADEQRDSSHQPFGQPRYDTYQPIWTPTNTAKSGTNVVPLGTLQTPLIPGTTTRPDLTGMAVIDRTLYTVSSQGVLYQIVPVAPTTGAAFANDNWLIAPIRTFTIRNPTTGATTPVPFSALTSGPATLEGGRYANMLFASTSDGEIWAFDTSGNLQPVFVNGQTKISTGIVPGVDGSPFGFSLGITGLAFSNLDYNLWHVTNQGPVKINNTPTPEGIISTTALPGHGQTVSPTNNALRNDPALTLNAGGGNSFYFGLDDPRNITADYQTVQPRVSAYMTGGPNYDSGNETLLNSYNMPGSAKGSLISAPFSLAGYTASDRPALYFNYALDTEQKNSDVEAPDLTKPGIPEDLNKAMNDSFRVFASIDGVNWTMLATNNSDRSPLVPTGAELPTVPTVSGGAYSGFKSNQQVQELFDDPTPTLPTATDPDVHDTINPIPFPTNPSEWRQARVDLGDFAGLSNIRLRFDFSTAGTMGIGEVMQGGTYLGVGDTTVLADGQTMVLTDTDSATSSTTTFTMKSGWVMQVAAGGGPAIPSGSTFKIVDRSNVTTTFEFTKNGTVTLGNKPINITDAMSAATVADIISQAISAAGLTGITPLRDSTFTLNAPRGGAGLVDGETFDVNVAGIVTRFELDDGAFVLNAPLGGAGVADGETFTVTVGVTPTTFEINKTGGVVPGRIAVPVTASMTPQDVAIAIGSAVQGAKIGVTPVLTGNGVQLKGASSGALGQASTLKLARVAAGNVPVPINHTMNPQAVTTAIANAVANARHFEIGAPFGGGGTHDGETFVITVGTTKTTFEMNSGGGVATGNIPVPFTTAMTAQQVAQAIGDAVTNAQIGVTAVLTPNGVHLRGVTAGSINQFNSTFEFNSLTQIDTPIGVTPTQTGDGVQMDGAKSVVLINSSGGLDLRETGARVQLSGFALQAPTGAAANNGEVFTVTVGDSTKTFQLRKPNGVAVGARTVDISTATTTPAVATAISNAIGAAALPGVTRVQTANGVLLFGTTSVSLDPDPAVNVEHLPGFVVNAPANGTLVNDAQLVTVTGPGGTRVFEIEKVGVRGTNRPVNIVNSMTQAQVETAIDNAIKTPPAVTGITTFTSPAGGLLIAGTNLNVTLPAASQNSLSLESGQFLNAPQGNVGLDSRTFTVTITIGSTPTSKTFELDTDGNFGPGTIRIDLTGATSSSDVAARIAAVVGSQAGFTVSPVLRNNGVLLKGNNIQVTGTIDSVFNIRTGFILSAPGEGAAIEDADTFTLTVGATNFVFELDKPNGLSDPSHIEVDVDPDDTRDVIVSAIANKIAQAGIGITPEILPNNAVQLGVLLTGATAVTETGGTLTVRQGEFLNVLQSLAGAVDGEQFKVTVGTTETVFEFQKPDTLVGIPIDITNGMTATQVANQIGAVVAANILDVTADTNNTDDIIHLMGATSVSVTPKSALTPGSLTLLVGASQATSQSSGLTIAGSAVPTTGEFTDVTYGIDMTPAHVARQIALALDNEFSLGNPSTDGTQLENDHLKNNQGYFTASKLNGNVLTVLGHHVISTSSNVALPFSDKLPGDEHGLDYSPTTTGFLFGVSVDNQTAQDRGRENQHQGVYIDDLVIGFASRGEMVTGVTGTSAGNTTFGPLPPNPDASDPQQIANGLFQLNIRRGTEYGQSVNGVSPYIQLTRTFDINDRLAQGFSFDAVPGSSLHDGDTFAIVVNAGVFTFEFDRGNGVSTPIAGNAAVIPILIQDTDDSETIAAKIVAAINSVPANLNFGVKAGVDPNGTRVDLFGAVDVRSGPLHLLTFDNLGDTLPVHVQGQTIVEGNIVSFSSQNGVAILPQAGTDELGNATGAPLVPGHTNSVANLPTLGTQQLVSGVTVRNNVVVSSGQNGILFSGTPANDIATSVPYFRILNNTLVANPVGIKVVNNASPSILNNIITQSSAAGIAMDPESVAKGPILLANVFQKNATNISAPGLSVNPADNTALGDSDPLFVNAATGNFYLAANSAAIGTSINSLDERAVVKAVNAPLAIPASTILAPDTDVLGQVRSDQSNPFKDRGAIERTDTNGPTAVLVNPVDNDAAVIDRSSVVTRVVLVRRVTNEFSIQLLDNGTGIKDSTVTDASNFKIEQTIGSTTKVLKAGEDFFLAYDNTQNIVTFRPKEGVWVDATYTITLTRSGQSGIQDNLGNLLKANQPNGTTTQFTIILTQQDLSPWQNQNPASPLGANVRLDVNNDGRINATDAGIVVTRLLKPGGAGPIPSSTPFPPYIDVDGDLRLSALDAILILSYLFNPTTTAAAATAAPASSTGALANGATETTAVAPAAMATPVTAAAPSAAPSVAHLVSSTIVASAQAAEADHSAVAVAVSMFESSRTSPSTSSPAAAVSLASVPSGSIAPASGANLAAIADRAIVARTEEQDDDATSDLDGALDDMLGARRSAVALRV